MALKAIALSVTLASALVAPTAIAQSITAEAAVVGGYSTDALHVAAAQVRGFGELAGGVRYFGELAWANSSNNENDAFAAAYPYGNTLDVIEAYAERMFRPGGGLVSLRGGRFRPPFGIYNASDHAYTGFLRPPLVRYDEYSGVTNYMLENGGDLTAGVPWLTVESALGAPGDVGEHTRASGVDSATRVQAYYGQLIAGASYLHTHPVQIAGDTRNGTASLGAVDLRWASAHGVQLRGEWIGGRPFDGATTNGWYADGIVHLLGMGPITAVARVEGVNFEEPSRGERSSSNRQTVGARLRLPLGFSVTMNLVHRTGDLKEYQPTSFDVGVMWTGRRGPR
jgi:hypothetical protein